MRWELEGCAGGPGLATGVGGILGGSSSERAMRAHLVVVLGEVIKAALERGDAAGWPGGLEMLLHRLMEALDFAAGLGMAGLGVFEGDAQREEL
jgi:hypothetical protein